MREITLADVVTSRDLHEGSEQMIKSIGLFWDPEDVHWGAGSQPGKLERCTISAGPVRLA
jgi:hypothetical protein